METPKNFAHAELSSAPSDTDTTLSFVSGHASRLSADSETPYHIVVWDYESYVNASIGYHEGSVTEIMEVTAVDTSNDTITVSRGQQGTSAVDFSGSSIVRVIEPWLQHMVEEIAAHLDSTSNPHSTGLSNLSDFATSNILEVAGLNNVHSVVSSNYTASPGEKIPADTSGGSFTITLDSGDGAGDGYIIFDAKDSWETNNLTLDGNGDNIEGDSTFTADVNGYMLFIVYNGTQYEVY